MYLAWLLNPDGAIHSETTIYWGVWLKYGISSALLVASIMWVVAYALSGFFPPRR